jgi:hypothetical protein
MRNKRKQKNPPDHGKDRQRCNPGKKRENHPSKPAGAFPYGFHERKTPRTDTTAFHHCLKKDHFDIGFEITWTNLTPAALNPCTDPGEPANMPDHPEYRNKNYFAGYDKRWLMIKDRLVISPFTVKSAIAGGFANLMGGCYRVIAKEEGHPDTITDGNYYYNGGYKRYRVAMNNSKPGIVKSIKVTENGDREIEIQPVTEYYCDAPLKGVTLDTETLYSADIFEKRHKQFIRESTLCEIKADQPGNHLMYFGPYRFGMDNGLKTLDLKKQHYHRFYKKKGTIKKALIPAVNFKKASELKKIVYMGDFRPVFRPDPRNGVKIWYQDLTSLDVGDWIYFQAFDDTIPAIGKNFQFKALFAHEDAVPENARLCTDKTRLCPRCRLFGMVETNQDKPGDVAAFKGRFKASALVDACPLTLSKDESSYPVPGTEETVSLKQWIDKKINNPVARQALLPIAGPPKPNKRDVDGYFNKNSGKIKGAKIYKHAGLKSAVNINGVDQMPANQCTHELRNYAMVCEKNRTFKGTVGAENCSSEEIAALFMLLDSSVLNYGYKLGLGKAFGMGTFTSAVTKVWVRPSQTYQWEAYDNPDEIRKQFETDIESLKSIELKLNNMANMETGNLSYPDPKNYWRHVRI